MNEARAEPSLLGLCLARRRKTIVKALWRDSDTVPEAEERFEYASIR